MKASYKKYILDFKRPSGTSRGVLTQKESWFIIICHNEKRGIGECGILRGLSIDDRPDYEERLKWTCDNIHLGEAALWEALMEFPSIQFGLQMAFRSLEGENPYVLFPSAFTAGEANIPINGLVWMGDEDYMMRQISEKLRYGYNCIKLKIGAIDFEKELDLLRFIRHNFTPEEVEIRVDANGAFTATEALHRLQQLAVFELHSIEQPIEKGQPELMEKLCVDSPLAIALDEELIGVFGKENKLKLLQQVEPQYIILKPSLIGGFRGTSEWIDVAGQLGIGWWITSALESNIGLNAIAQWTFLQNNKMPQGLGTGALYTNNFESPLDVKKGELTYNPAGVWKVNL